MAVWPFSIFYPLQITGKSQGTVEEEINSIGNVQKEKFHTQQFVDIIVFIFLKIFYPFIHRHTEREAETGRGRSRLHAGSRRDSIPGL